MWSPLTRLPHGVCHLMCGVPGSATGCAGILCVRIPARYGCFPAVGLNSRGPNTLARSLDVPFNSPGLARSLGLTAITPSPACRMLARSLARSMVARSLDGTRWNAVVLHAGMRWYCTLECGGIARWNAVVFLAGMLWYCSHECGGIVLWNAVASYAGIL